MSAAHALDLFSNLLRVTMLVSAPLLLASLLAGLGVGIAQAATQINESSVSFVVKVVSVTGAIIVVGPTLAIYTIDYTRQTLGSIERVVRE
jgi:flagellar biosynthetic protein FliQ